MPKFASFENVNQDAKGNWWGQRGDPEDGLYAPQRLEMLAGGDGDTRTRWGAMQPWDIARKDSQGTFNSEQALSMLSGINEGEARWESGDTIPYASWFSGIWDRGPGYRSDPVWTQAFGGRQPDAKQYLNSLASDWRLEGDQVRYSPESQKVNIPYYGKNEWWETAVPALLLSAWGGALSGALNGAMGGVVGGGSNIGGLGGTLGVSSTGNLVTDSALKALFNSAGTQALGQVMGPGNPLPAIASTVTGGFEKLPSFGGGNMDLSFLSSLFGGGDGLTPSVPEVSESFFGDGLGGSFGESLLGGLASGGGGFDSWFNTSPIGLDGGYDSGPLGMGSMSSMTMPQDSGGFSDLLRRLKGMPWKGAAGGLDIAKSLYGLSQASRLSKMSQQMMERSDPYGPYRGDAAARLARLTSNPSLISETPGYEAGMQAIQRGLAGSGYLGSGNEKIAMMKYGGDIYNQETSRLAQLAGAGFSPAAASQVGLQGQAGAMNLRGNALNNLARGIWNWGA